MKIILFSVIILFVCQFFPLNSQNNPGKSQNTTKEIIPLAEGNFWTYQNYYYRSPRKDSINNADSVTLHVGKKILFNNQDWYPWGVLDWDYSNIGINQKDGFYRIFFNNINNISIDSACLFFKYPTKNGDKYYSGCVYDTLHIISIDEEVTVPAGTFKCIHYRTIDSDKYPDNEFFISPGVGMVKCEIINGIDKSYPIPDTVWIILKLTKYQVK
jgi:hypothetical protein